MEERDYYIILYDLYSSLFSVKQKEYFEDYYFNNLSLSEISENVGVSRNAIHKQIKDASEKLIWYESNLKLYEKSKKINKLLQKIENEKLKEEIKELI